MATFIITSTSQRGGKLNTLVTTLFMFSKGHQVLLLLPAFGAECYRLLHHGANAVQHARGEQIGFYIQAEALRRMARKAGITMTGRAGEKVSLDDELRSVAEGILGNVCNIVLEQCKG